MDVGWLRSMTTSFAFFAIAFSPAVIQGFHVAGKQRFAQFFIHQIVLFTRPLTQFFARRGLHWFLFQILLKIKGTPSTWIKSGKSIKKLSNGLLILSSWFVWIPSGHGMQQTPTSLSNLSTGWWTWCIISHAAACLGRFIIRICLCIGTVIVVVVVNTQHGSIHFGGCRCRHDFQFGNHIIACRSIAIAAVVRHSHGSGCTRNGSFQC
mmetsp:Transcript_13196/g.17268  ORF Transcript_13196/g.17268 Transcript_13196/m.17268 type:complete len:208 (+) Transcript_13196:55-678(+)